MLLLTLAPAVVAQATTNWDRVGQLTPSQQIRVTLLDGRKVRGEFESASGDAVMVRTPKSEETLGRIMVARVASKGKSHRLRNALIGLGAGAAGGLIAGAVTDAKICHPNVFLGCLGGRDIGKVVLTPFGALVGVIVGALIPTGGYRDIYRVK